MPVQVCCQLMLLRMPRCRAQMLWFAIVMMAAGGSCTPVVSSLDKALRWDRTLLQDPPLGAPLGLFLPP
jgi:hypothetical protein